MKNKLRTGFGFAGLLLLLALSGCERVSEPETAKLRIVTTIFPPYDFVRQIGGDDVEVTMLLKPGMESHSYEPTPSDIVTIMQSDLFLYAGGESDAWVQELLAGNDGQTRSYALMDWVEPLPEEKKQGVYLEEGEYDEHVWTSPKNAILLVDRICEAMSECDRAHEDRYRANAARYEKQLEELDAAFAETVQNGKRNLLIFGDRFPLLYFVHTYGLSYEAAFPGCSDQTEPSAAVVASLTDRVRQEQIPVVFYLELSGGKIAKAIAEAAGAKTAVFYSVHTVSQKDFEAGETYLSLMYRNVETLREALD